MKYVIIQIIRLYQSCISVALPFNHCRFYPSCSKYTIEAVENHGIFSGMWLAMKRIVKCHPYSPKSGYDPVP